VICSQRQRAVQAGGRAVAATIRHDRKADTVTGARPRWLPPEPPTLIVIYPDPRNDRWRHATYHSSRGIADGSLPVPGDAPPDRARQAAEAMVVDLARTYYNIHCTIDWHPPDDKGWITGDVRSNPQPAENPG
jgi:hypothetical protein